MAGLLSQGMGQPHPNQQPPQGPQEAAQPQQQGDDPSVNYDPEQGQQMYQVLTEGMLESLYSSEEVEQVLTAHENPVEGMSQVIASIMLTAHQALTDQGSTVPPGVMFQAGMELAKAVGEIAIHMGMLGDDEAEAIESAFMMALGRFGQMAADDLTPQKRERYAELIRTLRDAKPGAPQGRHQDMPQEAPQGGQPPMTGGA